MEEFLRARPDSVRKILALPSFGRKSYQARLLNLAKAKGVEVSVRDRFQVDLVPPDAVHQGVAALVVPVWEVGLDAISPSSKAGERITVVACDQVTDPRNLGAILRSVAALAPGGYVLLPKRGSAPINGTVVKASAGLIVRTRVCVVSNLVRALDTLKDRGFWIYGLHPSGERALWDADISGSAVVVLGAEGAGLRKLVQRTCDMLLSIPFHRPVDSLNVSAAATVFLYEALRQDRKNR